MTPDPGTGRYLCLSVDVQGYSNHDDLRQSAIQGDLIGLLEQAADRTGLDRGRWIRQAKGDEELALIPAADGPERVVGDFCLELDAALRRHNSARSGDSRLRLRLAMDEGIVTPARNGFAGRTVVAVSRLVSSSAPREALRRGQGSDLAVVLSDRVYADWVCTGRAGVRADLFRRVVVEEKGFVAVAWLWLPGGQEDSVPEPATPPSTQARVPRSSRYGRLARLVPAVLMTLPVAVLALVSLPAAGLTAGSVVVLVGVCAVPLLTAQLVRDRGRRFQGELFRRWGGRPTEVLLRWRDAGAPEVVARRHQLIARHLGFLLPDEKTEVDDPAAADQEYAAAIAALRERTRDPSRFPLVLAENIAYGFWRNMYACRAPAVVVCALAAVAALVLGALVPESLSWPQRAGLLLFDAGAAGAWLGLCRPQRVRRAAAAYASQLLASLETLR